MLDPNYQPPSTSLDIAKLPFKQPSLRLNLSNNVNNSPGGNPQGFQGVDF